jgi:hypothetical protein
VKRPEGVTFLSGITEPPAGALGTSGKAGHVDGSCCNTHSSAEPRVVNTRKSSQNRRRRARAFVVAGATQFGVIMGDEVKNYSWSIL